LSQEDIRTDVGLAAIVKDEVALRHYRLVHIEDGSDFFVYGDGRLVLQRRPSVGVSGNDTPQRATCTTTVSQSEIESLIRLMIQRHFEKLPQKGFPNFVGATEAFPWKLHIIVVAAGPKRGTWVFGTGEMNGRVESIPPDFAAVEDALRPLRAKAAPADGRPCPLAPEVQWQE